MVEGRRKAAMHLAASLFRANLTDNKASIFRFTPKGLRIEPTQTYSRLSWRLQFQAFGPRSLGQAKYSIAGQISGAFLKPDELFSRDVILAECKDFDQDHVLRASEANRPTSFFGLPIRNLPAGIPSMIGQCQHS